MRLWHPRLAYLMRLRGMGRGWRWKRGRLDHVQIWYSNTNKAISIPCLSWLILIYYVVLKIKVSKTLNGPKKQDTSQPMKALTIVKIFDLVIYDLFFLHRSLCQEYSGSSIETIAPILYKRYVALAFPQFTIIILHRGRLLNPEHLLQITCGPLKVT